MKKLKVSHSFYYTLIFILIQQIELINTRTFSYKDNEYNDYIKVYDRTKMTSQHNSEENTPHDKRQTTHDKIHERFRRFSSSRAPKNVKAGDDISSHHIFINDSNNVAFVFWKHAETTVILILTCHDANTTNFNKHSNKGCKSKSKFYRSSDHGKTFEPVTKGIDGAHLHSIYLSPKNKKFIVLTDYKNKTLYLTNDVGKTFQKHKMVFQPTFIYFHPTREDYIAAYDNTHEGRNSLYLSKDRGLNWTLVSYHVRNYFWGRPKYDEDDRMIYIEKESNRKLDTKTPTSELYLSVPPYNTIRPINTGNNGHLLPYSVFVGETYIIVQHLYDHKIYVCGKKSRNFIMANFDKIDRTDRTHVMQVVVSDENDEILLALVYNNLVSSLYLSDHEGKNFRLRKSQIDTEPVKSLVVPPKMDLYVVKGVVGTYICNKKSTKASLITFDKGHTWRPITVDNLNSKGGKLNQRCRAKCDIRLYLKIEPSFSDFTALIISKENAPGIILAQGNIGGFFTSVRYFVFISTDGGMTWKQRLSHTHGYVILDHGGLIAATPLKYSSGPNNATVAYSIDYGKTWNHTHLTTLYSRIAAIITESTASLLVMNVFGFLYPDKQASGIKGNTWIAWQFNFTKVLKRPCDPNKDFERWKHFKDFCVMGERLSNLRRIADHACIAGPKFDNNLTRTKCPCTYDDYACDEKYIRVKKGDHHECEPINKKYKKTKVCEQSKFYIKSAGYHKLYGNKCVGGVEKKLLKTRVNCTVDAPGKMKIKVPTTIVGVNQPLNFEIEQVEGFYKALYTWTFNNTISVKKFAGNFSNMRTLTYAFPKPGYYIVTVDAKNLKGTSKANITVSVIENIQLHAHIMYDHPLVVDMPKSFALKTFAPNGSLVLVRYLPSTKIMWSFDGKYIGGDNSIVREYTFRKAGVVNVEVQVMNSVSLEVYQERISVYEDALVVTVSFSPKLDELNEKSSEWIINFESKYRVYLDNRYEFEREGIAKRILVRGKPETPTKLSIIIYDTKESRNQIDSASSIAERIRDDIVKNKPIVKGYEDKEIRAINAYVSKFDKQISAKPSGKDKPNKYAWVYIIVAMLIIAAVITIIAYYRYRFKGIGSGLTSCVFVNDNMGTQLIDEDDDVDMDPEPPENFNRM